MSNPSPAGDKSELEELKRSFTALRERVKTLEAANDHAEERASKAEAANEKLAERLANVEAAEDPLPDRFEEAKAAGIVDRLLGISKIEMSDDVEALLWAHAMRRLGVLSGKEYERRKKRLLARDIPPASSSSTPSTGDEKDGTAVGAKPGAATQGTKKGSKE